MIKKCTVLNVKKNTEFYEIDDGPDVDDDKLTYFFLQL